MKKILIILLLFVCLTVQATDKYIATAANGGSNGNSGAIGSPWLTLSYACSNVSIVGDIIHVNAGTYTETSQCVLTVGVSIEGIGVTSHIISQVVFTRAGDLSGAAITCSSASEGTNGNQHISGIKLDGNYYAGTTYSGSADGNAGILVQRRSNVKIYNCTIIGFYLTGVALHGSDPYQQPSIYASGNEIYNCIITGNGDTDTTWGGGGQIEIGGQSGTLIHDNTIDGTTRSVGHNGNFLSGAYHNKGVKVYNNISYKLDNEGGAWNFHIEMWNTDGGFEVYNNEFHDGDCMIDMAGYWNYKGDYAYSWNIHDNLFESTPIVHTGDKLTLQMEGSSVLDVWIYRNHFINQPTPINTTRGGTVSSELKRIYIAYNLFENCGWNDGAVYATIMNFHNDIGTLEDIFIYNNIIEGDNVTHTTAITLNPGANCTVSNFNIKNNIVVNNSNGTWFNVVNNGSINGLYVNNNILYNNANSSDPVFGGNSVIDYTFTNNLKVNPLFVSTTDFHLQTASPAKDAGVNVGLTRDFDNLRVPFNSISDIGAYEYGGVRPTGLFSGGKVLISGGKTLTY